MARYYGNDGGYGSYSYYGWRPYVSQAERRLQALRKVRQLRKGGRKVSPVEIGGRKIATTFWGSAWCDNLERYSDFANRLPRGRTYVRNGSVIDLQIAAGKVTALVSGSEIYEVRVEVAPVAVARWRAMCGRCAGGIDSLVELLQGRFCKAVMEHLCRQGTGLFPTPGDIRFSCSCPDWASMCKHVAAVLYGVGARLDEQPELLFRLRKVNERDLLARAGTQVPFSKKKPAASKVLADEELAEVFGVELVAQAAKPAKAPKRLGSARLAKAIEAAAATKPAGPGKPGASPVAGSRPQVSAARAAEPPGFPAAGAVASGHQGTKARKTLGAAQRKAITDRMKRYWQERRREMGRRKKS